MTVTIWSSYHECCEVIQLWILVLIFLEMFLVKWKSVFSDTLASTAVQKATFNPMKLENWNWRLVLSWLCSYDKNGCWALVMMTYHKSNPPSWVAWVWSLQILGTLKVFEVTGGSVTRSATIAWNCILYVCLDLKHDILVQNSGRQKLRRPYDVTCKSLIMHHTTDELSI